MARGLIKAFDEMEIRIPVVIRLAGTNEDEGREILKKFVVERELDVHLVDSMEEGARKSVELLNSTKSG